MSKTIEELGEELCDYCPLEYKHSGNFSDGCEGSNCENAYELYLDIEEENSK